MRIPIGDGFTFSRISLRDERSRRAKYSKVIYNSKVTLLGIGATEAEHNVLKQANHYWNTLILFFNFLLFIYLFIIMNTHLLFNLPFYFILFYFMFSDLACHCHHSLLRAVLCGIPILVSNLHRAQGSS